MATYDAPREGIRAQNKCSFFVDFQGNLGNFFKYKGGLHLDLGLL